MDIILQAPTFAEPEQSNAFDSEYSDNEYGDDEYSDDAFGDDAFASEKRKLTITAMIRIWRR